MQATIHYFELCCSSCGVRFAVDGRYLLALARGEGESEDEDHRAEAWKGEAGDGPRPFRCPNGHLNVYHLGETAEERRIHVLEEELCREKRRAELLEAQLEQARRGDRTRRGQRKNRHAQLTVMELHPGPGGFESGRAAAPAEQRPENT